MNARRRRLTIILLVVIPITLLLVGSIIYIVTQARQTLRRVDVILVEEIERQTNRAVEVGRVDVSLFSGVAAIHDFRIADGESFAEGTLLEAEKVVVNFRFRDLIFGRVPPIQSIESVRLVSPAIRLERFRDGQFNIQDLLVSRPGPPMPPFTGVVDVTNGTLILRDWLALVPGAKPAVTQVVDLEGTFDATNVPLYVYNFTARGPDGRLFDTLSLSGSIDNRTSTISTDIIADNASAAYWMNYFIRPGAVRVRSGCGDVRISLDSRLVNGRRVWSYTGSADVRNASATVSWLREPATNVSGRIRLANQTFDFNLAGSVAGSPIRMTGTMAGFEDPRFNLRVVSSSINYPRLLNAVQSPVNLGGVRLIGRGPLTLDIAGRSNNLVIAARGTIPTARADGYQATDIAIRATYADNVIAVESATARTLNGRVAASGTVTALDGAARLAITGTASGAELGLIPQLRQTGLQGTAAGRFAVVGTTAAPRLDANVQVSRGTLDNLVFRNAVANLSITADQVRIHSLAAAVAGGVVRASGDIAPSQLALRAVATGVDMNLLQRPLGLTGYAGIVNFEGNVTGAFANPLIVGRAEVFDGRFQRFAFDYARGQITATTEGITLDDAVVRILPAEVALRGRIAGIGTQTPTIEFDVDVVDAPADRIIELLQAQADITGAVTGRLTIRGTAPNIVATGMLTLTDGAVAGFPITEARAAFAYADGQLRLTDLLARSDGAVFSADGIIDAQGNIAFNFVANDVSLVRISEFTQPYAALSGVVDATGSVTGTTESPVVAATVVSNNPVINTVRFNRFAAEVAWSERSLAVSNAALQLGEGVFSIERAAVDNITDAALVEGGVLQNFSYPAIYTVVSESPYINQPEGEGLRTLLARLRRPDTGIVSASFAAQGPVDALEAKFSLAAQDIDISEIRNAKIELAAVSRRGQVILESFEATAEALSVSARGALVADGQTDLEIDAYNVDLDALTSATGPTHIRGIATVRASIQGPIDAPLITASFEVVDPVIYGIEFDRFRASQITVSQNEIEISRALVTRDAQSATLFGTLPWDWTALTVPADRPIALHAALEEQTLEILTMFSDAITADPENPGRITADLDITGTLSRPNLSGQMIVADGNVSVRNFQTSFTNVQANLVFDQDVMRVETLSGASTGGGTFEVVPGGTISLGNLVQPAEGPPAGSLDIVVRLNDLFLAQQNLLGYQERVSGRFSTVNGLTASGTISEPLISGQVRVRDTTVILSRVPAGLPAAARDFVINPGFDIAFSIEDNVWFRNPNIVALLEGDGRISGTLENPLVTAEVRMSRGTLRLPTARMRITRGNINVNWSPADPASRMTVDLRAQTTLTATSPLGLPRRYTIYLEIDAPIDRLEPEDIDLRSDPAGLSRTQILAALGHFEDIFGTGEIELRDQLRDLFSVAISPRLFDPLETTFVEALGLEEFTIEYGFEQPLAVFLTRRLFDEVYLSYWRIVTGAPNITGATYSLRLSYRVRDWLEIGYVTDSRRVNILEASYNRRF